MSKPVLNRETVLEDLRRLKPDLERRFGVIRLGLFGSVARGQAGEESDVDIVVEMAPDLFKRAELKIELEALLGRKVDVVRYGRRMNGQLKKRIDFEALYV
jgi:uncharacterized protein